MQKVENLSGEITTEVQDLIVASVQTWLNEHPVIAWILHHPLWSVGIVLLFIFLFWGLLAAIARLTQQAWAKILQAPLLLAGKVLGLGFTAFKFNSSQPVDLQDKKSNLADVLKKLEMLRQEQDQLMQQVKEILASNN